MVPRRSECGERKAVFMYLPRHDLGLAQGISESRRLPRADARFGSSESRLCNQCGSWRRLQHPSPAQAVLRTALGQKRAGPPVREGYLVEVSIIQILHSHSFAAFGVGDFGRCVFGWLE